jgi:GT2 family glycosyltransferase/SAM-dependent methyltransferase
LTLRRAGAPRLIEWTGERCVPWGPDVQVVYEHFLRYRWAAEIVSGRRVLDLASGEGFGAAILAESAESVVGVDIDEQTVEHSRLNYDGPAIDFQVGDARDLSGFEAASFGAVVAFEMIEHVDEHARVLDEITRVLEPGGLLILSTPNRRAYSDAIGQNNPFHLHELSLHELVALLSERFAHHRLWGQRTITGSTLSSLTGAPPDRDRGEAAQGEPGLFFLERTGEEWSFANGLSPLYLVGLASSAPLPDVATSTTLADCGIGLVRAAEAKAQRQRAALLAEERSAGAATEAERKSLEERTRAYSQRRRDDELRIETLRQRVSDLVGSDVEKANRIAQLEADLAQSRQVIAWAQASMIWRLLQRLRQKGYAAIGGERSLVARGVRKSVREARRSLAGVPSVSLPDIELPEYEHPTVSVVIPVYGAAAELTRGTLESIRDNTPGIPYEVIVVDDRADRETRALLRRTSGLRTLVNKSNLGYLRSVNRGAAVARGRWLVLCNDDIRVLSGWLQEMLRCAESSPDIGIVTPKYLAADWSLGEAGGVIWNDGTGGNYGRGQRPDDYRYEFRRDVDYGSAAALLVNAEFWRQAGGFDERFAPMYYEDTDLSFQARALGWRVVYEPRANVLHLEGGTAGTDVTVGNKRHQELNRHKFFEKWRPVLATEQLPPAWANARLASDRRRGPHVLIVDHRVPMWDRDSGSLRLYGIIQSLLGLGYKITFLPDDLHMVSPYTSELQSLGVEVLYGKLDIEAELTELARGLTAVITCRPHATSRLLDLIRGVAPNVPVVYDTVDLHWVREARKAAQSGHESPNDTPRVVALRELELALIRATDATLVVTETERRQVLADVRTANVHVVPNVNEVMSRVSPPQSRAGVIFVGGFEHVPNIDAAIVLVRDVMPHVWRELGDVKVSIIGSSPPPAVRALASELVDVTGWVPELDPVLQSARALVAPLTYGAGLKGKVTQALAHGLPVVTTPIGAEGLDAVDGEHLLMATQPRALADQVVSVLRDDELWQRLSRGGQRLAAERCSPALMTERLIELLQSVSGGPGVDRAPRSEPAPAVQPS